MSTTRVLDDAPWLTSGPTVRVLELLSGNGEEARVVGGAVRNALFKIPTGDIDIAQRPAVTVRVGEVLDPMRSPPALVHIDRVRVEAVFDLGFEQRLNADEVDASRAGNRYLLLKPGPQDRLVIEWLAHASGPLCLARMPVTLEFPPMVGT